MTVRLTHLHSGKVRDVYGAGADHLLMVMSDRLSAFDVVMAEPVPDKGRVLTALSAFWFGRVAPVARSHFVSTDLADFPAGARDPALEGRAMLVRRADMLSIECIVRGYLAGSAWREYQADGTIHGVQLAGGLRLADRLPEPLFTPSTKAQDGAHDVNISFADAADIVGAEVAERCRDLALSVFAVGAEHAASQGIILADTKLELGWIDGELVIADELLTPDSSRFWPADQWEPGLTPPSFDKQPVRDYLDGLDWNKEPPPPPLPDHVIRATRDRYVEACERLTGAPLSRWPG